MYFKKLELVGFKSFMEKTTLHFEPGITAVVGPNGAGKSNVFDSIRWVLGEQSVKALRGSQMEDVIFNGSDSKESLGMAEVSLTFSNEKKFFPVDHDEVIITRRIFRSGESEYLLNKAQVRLKDISDLLMGTGIGAESYSLVEQGKIDLVLSSRPEDRRLVFDEAAGITRYKSQKKEALRKLEEAEQNLLRVNDIIAEVKRQIGSLERQANKARRYREVFEELKAKEVNFAVFQKRKLASQKSEITANLSELEAKESELINIIEEQEAQINSRDEELKNLQSEVTAARGQISGLDNFIAVNNGRISSDKERLAELGATKNYLEAQVEQGKTKLMSNEEKLKKARQEYEGLAKIIEEKSRLLKDTECRLEGLNASVKISSENIAGAKKKILNLANQAANIKNELADLTAKKQIYLARQKRLEIEKAKINEEKGAIEDNLRSINAEVETLEKNFQALNSKASQAKNELEQDNSGLARIKRDLEELERQKLTLESQREFLEKLKTKYEDISESSNALIYLDKLPAEKITGLVVKINDCSELSGPDDKRHFESAQVKLKGEAKPIDLDTQRIDAKISQIGADIANLAQSKTKKEADIAGLENIIRNFSDDLRKQEIILENKRTFRQGIVEQLNKASEEEELITVELSEIQQELAGLEDKLSRQEACLLDLDKEQRRAEDLITAEQNNIAANGVLKEKILVEITRVKTEFDALNKRIVSDEASFRAQDEAYRQDKETLLNLQAQIKDIQLKEESLKAEIKDLEVKTAQAQNDLLSRRSALEGMEGKYKTVSLEAANVIRRIESDRKELDSLKNSLYELQMQNKDVDFKILGITERMLQAYKIDLAAQEAAGQNTQQAPDEGLLSEEIKRLKEKLDTYGTVNLVAIEEYDELKKRYDFLIRQQGDLLAAKESLHEAIQKINRTTRKMFLETFQKVSVEFRNYFRLLFNGGDAQIFLIDEQEPLESGIEIICRPPGKKLQNVLLLSGGEKSLSAIALIFAIFKIKPSPFCVLDEIDAALDEANVDRFGRILQEFINESQFIIITHNKKTIANASVMYGITMEESGVSKIVSVKFSQNNAAKDKELIAEPA